MSNIEQSNINYNSVSNSGYLFAIAFLVVLLIGVCMFSYYYILDVQSESDRRCGVRVSKESDRRNFLIKAEGADNKCLSFNDTDYSFINCSNLDSSQKFYYDATKTNIKQAETNACVGLNDSTNRASSIKRKLYLDPQCADEFKYNYKLIPISGEKGPRLLTSAGYLYYYDGKFGVSDRERFNPNLALNFELIRT